MPIPTMTISSTANIRIISSFSPIPIFHNIKTRRSWSLTGSTLHPLPLVTKCSSSSSSSSLSDMDGAGSPSLFPQHRTKTLHLVRHAQGVHNVEGEKNHDAYLSEELFDAHLTPLGWQQVDNLRKHVIKCGLTNKIDLVVVSPLLRTLQTAVGTFGGESNVSGNGTKPLMVENAGNSNRSEISGSDRPPFVAVELCREHLGVHPCDRRRSITEYQPLFPAIDFSLIENNEDILWKSDTREADSDLAARGKKFINWLWTRKEKEIAVVTHSGFLFHTLAAFGKDLHPTMKEEICKHFANCELRSVVIIDKNMAGSDASTTNYPGKIPYGMDLPSEETGVHPCDRRRSITEYQALFPAIDFPLIENNEDILWKPDTREVDADLAARGKKFINWLWTRKEKEIAVVTHSGFLFHTLAAFGKDLHPTMKEEIFKHFANCELRSVVIIDKNMAGSDASTTNYPGKIPYGMDLPSE